MQTLWLLTRWTYADSAGEGKWLFSHGRHSSCELYWNV